MQDKTAESLTGEFWPTTIIFFTAIKCGKEVYTVPLKYAGLKIFTKLSHFTYPDSLCNVSQKQTRGANNVNNGKLV